MFVFMSITNILCVIIYLREQLLQLWEKLVVLKTILSVIYFLIILSFLEGEQLKGITAECLCSSISMSLKEVSLESQGVDVVRHRKVCVLADSSDNAMKNNSNRTIAQILTSNQLNLTYLCQQAGRIAQIFNFYCEKFQQLVIFAELMDLDLYVILNDKIQIWFFPYFSVAHVPSLQFYPNAHIFVLTFYLHSSRQEKRLFF